MTEQLVERELRRPSSAEQDCPGCGTRTSRLVAMGFGKRWRIVCRCGFEYEHGCGKLPEGE